MMLSVQPYVWALSVTKALVMTAEATQLPTVETPIT